MLKLDEKDMAFSTPVGALRCTENDVEMPADGGRVIFTLPPGPLTDELYENQKITGVTVLLNYRKDEPMRDHPATREQKEAERYTLYLVKEPRTATAPSPSKV